MRMHGRSFDGKKICDKTFPGSWEAGKALATPLVVWGNPECRRRGACVKTLANIGGPPCTEVGTEGRPRGPGNDMPGHAAHEAQQSGANSRHKSTGAGTADESLPYRVEGCPLSAHLPGRKFSQHLAEDRSFSPVSMHNTRRRPEGRGANCQTKVDTKNTPSSFIFSTVVL